MTFSARVNGETFLTLRLKTYYLVADMADLLEAL